MGGQQKYRALARFDRCVLSFTSYLPPSYLGTAGYLLILVSSFHIYPTTHPFGPTYAPLLAVIGVPDFILATAQLSHR